MKGDPLTDILTLASARCVEVGILVAGGSWALRFPPPKKIKFVAVVKGECWLSLEGQVATLRVKTGDVFVLPAERAFVIAGDLNSPPIDGLRVFTGATDKIATVGDGDDFFAVGADAIQVGTASFADPTTALRVLDGLAERAAAGRIPARWGTTAVGSP